MVISQSCSHVAADRERTLGLVAYEDEAVKLTLCVVCALSLMQRTTRLLVAAGLPSFERCTDCIYRAEQRVDALEQLVQEPVTHTADRGIPYG